MYSEKIQYIFLKEMPFYISILSSSFNFRVSCIEYTDTIQENNQQAIWELVPLCLNTAQKIFPCLLHSTYILYGSRKRRNETRWFFFRPHSPSQETYYIVYTRYKKYLSKYNQGCDLRPSKFDIFVIYCII